jgi:glycosyltransferase involved in cell wall biosynthesis
MSSRPGSAPPASDGAGQRPRISVLVFAHDRRTYLREAIESVWNQTVPRGAYELLVVTNFADSDLDRALVARGGRLLTTDAPFLGGKVAAGLDSANGEILTFLEDDDRYEPGRLARVLEVFDRDPALGYYANGQTFVRAGGEPFPETELPRAVRRRRRMGSIEVRPSSPARHWQRLARVDPDFNLSSLAVRRAVGFRVREALRNSEAAVDSLLFFQAASEGRRILVDGRPLTQYRVHADNLSLRWDDGSSEGTYRRRAEYVDRFLRSFEPIYRRARAEAPRGAVRMAGAAFYGTRVLRSVVDAGASRGAVLRDLTRYVRFARGRAFTDRLDVLAYGTAYLVSPRAARSAYVGRRAARPW